MANVGEEIKIADIRKGDVIRRVPLLPIGQIRAVEWLADEDGDSFGFGAVDSKFTLVEKGEWVPLDVTFIAWVDYDREINVAFRTGHPKNHVWSYNNATYTEEVFRPMVERQLAGQITYLIPQEEVAN